MKFKPVYIEENVNISKESPLKKAFVLLTWLVGITIISYFALGLIGDVVVTNLPPATEQKLGNMLWRPPTKTELPEKQAEIQTLLDSLVAELPEKDRQYEYKVYLIKEKTFNAFAAPGGNIGVFEGLYKETKSEEELAFVLAHELGHLVHKDPLKALSRRFLISIVSQVIFGDDNLIKSIVGGSINNLDLSFSRSVETRADLFAAELIHKKYGNVSGALKFMERMEEKQKLKLPRFVHYFSTHPASDDRIKAIEEYAKGFN